MEYLNIVKYLQKQGIGSKKECRKLIIKAEVIINNKLCTNIDEVVDIKNVFSLKISNVETILIPIPYCYILLNKPRNYETSHNPSHYPSIFSLLPKNISNINLNAVGRLDVDTTGAIIITNDGKLNHFLTSPKNHIAKIYLVHLKYSIDDIFCKKLLDGVILKNEKKIIKADDVKLCDSKKILLTISSGIYHQVKRMIAVTGNRVEGLHRIGLGNINTNDMEIGTWKFITKESIINKL